MDNHDEPCSVGDNWDDEPLELQREDTTLQFDRIREKLMDALRQTETLPSDMARQVLADTELEPECDRLAEGIGPFGTCRTNAIPVNGITGELVYINRLRSSSGCAFLFHRLGSHVAENYPRPVDEFELLSVDGAMRIHLFLAMYYPRRSQLLPSGVTRTRWIDMSDMDRAMCKIPAYGVTSRLSDFPWALPLAIRSNATLCAVAPWLGDVLARNMERLLQELRERTA